MAPSAVMGPAASPVGLRSNSNTFGQKAMLKDRGSTFGSRCRGQSAADVPGPNPEHEAAANVPRPAGAPDGAMPAQALGIRVQAYGFDEYVDLFTPRQLTALTTYCDLVSVVREKVLGDAFAAGGSQGSSLSIGGTDAAAFADAIATYLGLAVSRTADLNNTLVTWSNSRDQARNLFARQALSMSGIM